MPRTTSQTSSPSLFDNPRPGNNTPEFSVSDLSKLVKKTMEDTFGLVRVRGEIGDCKHHSNGHIYITLKDETAILASVVWRGQTSKLGIRPEIGMEVVCTGRLTTYAGQSKYQLVIEGMALAGVGALLKLLEERKQKLAAEGLFDPARKQLLPYLPEIIGVITSPTGAVIRDILHRLEDRFPRHVLVWPVAVQGEGAAEQIAAAIKGFNALADSNPELRPDLLIVARGGGSVEDLMPFNEEIVVRAAAASNIPLISAVGHETDTTLIDYAADIRAPTPTAAAEMAVPVRADIMEQVADHGMRLNQGMRRRIAEHREKLELLSRSLGEPSRALEPLMQRLDERAERLPLAWRGYVNRKTSYVSELGGKLRHPRDIVRLAHERLIHIDHKMSSGWRELFLRRQHRLETISNALSLLSPRAVLGRGYALVQNTEGHIVTNKKQLKPGDAISIEFADGKTGATVKE
jgi:exodeoxyribonuclease VII large subunit